MNKNPKFFINRIAPSIENKMSNSISTRGQTVKYSNNSVCTETTKKNNFNHTKNHITMKEKTNNITNLTENNIKELNNAENRLVPYATTQQKINVQKKIEQFKKDIVENDMNNNKEIIQKDVNNKSKIYEHWRSMEELSVNIDDSFNNNIEKNILKLCDYKITAKSFFDLAKICTLNYFIQIHIRLNQNGTIDFTEVLLLHLYANGDVAKNVLSFDVFFRQMKLKYNLPINITVSQELVKIPLNKSSIENLIDVKPNIATTVDENLLISKINVDLENSTFLAISPKENPEILKEIYLKASNVHISGNTNYDACYKIFDLNKDIAPIPYDVKRINQGLSEQNHIRGFNTPKDLESWIIRSYEQISNKIKRVKLDPAFLDSVQNELDFMLDSYETYKDLNKLQKNWNCFYEKHTDLFFNNNMGFNFATYIGAKEDLKLSKTLIAEYHKQFSTFYSLNSPLIPLIQKNVLVKNPSAGVIKDFSHEFVKNIFFTFLFKQ